MPGALPSSVRSSDSWIMEPDPANPERPPQPAHPQPGAIPLSPSAVSRTPSPVTPAGTPPQQDAGVQEICRDGCYMRQVVWTAATRARFFKRLLQAPGIAGGPLGRAAARQPSRARPCLPRPTGPRSSTCSGPKFRGPAPDPGPGSGPGPHPGPGPDPGPGSGPDPRPGAGAGSGAGTGAGTASGSGAGSGVGAGSEARGRGRIRGRAPPFFFGQLTGAWRPSRSSCRSR